LASSLQVSNNSN